MDRRPAGLRRCPEARALLPEYVEGELGAGDRVRVAAHLDICAACRAEESAYRQSLGALRAAPLPQAPPDLYAGFAAKRAAMEQRGRVNGTRLRLAFAAGFAVLVVGVSARPLVRLMMPRPSPVQMVRNPVPAPVSPVEPTSVPSPAPNPPVIVWNPPPPDPAPNPTPIVPRGFAGVVPEEPNPVQVITPKQLVRRNGPEHYSKAEEPKADHGDAQRIPESERGAFLSVQPTEGMSAEQVLKARQMAATQPLVKDRDDKIQVGNRLTRIETGYRVDAAGRRTAVSVNIATTAEPVERQQ